MIRKPEEQKIENKCIRGGDGLVAVRSLLNGADEMNGKGRMFSRMVLAPGCGIGPHTHAGDSEIFYFLSGEGVYDDNGTTVTVHPGDVAVCNAGEAHSLRNEGTEPLELIALILFA